MFAAVAGGLRHLAGSLWSTPDKPLITSARGDGHSSSAAADSDRPSSNHASPDDVDDPMDVSYLDTPQHPSAMPITPLVAHATLHPHHQPSSSTSAPSHPSPVPFSLHPTQTPPPSPAPRRHPLPSVPLFTDSSSPSNPSPPTTTPLTADALPRKGWSIVIDPDPAEKENDPPVPASTAPPPSTAEDKQPTPPPSSSSVPPAALPPTPPVEEEVAARKRKRDSSVMVDVGDMDVDEPSTPPPSTPPISANDDPLYPHSLKKLRLHEEGVGPAVPLGGPWKVGAGEKGKKRDSLTSRLRALVMDSYSAMFAQPGVTAQDHLGAQMQRMHLQQQQQQEGVAEPQSPPPPEQPHPEQPQFERKAPHVSPPASPPMSTASASTTAAMSASSRFEAIRAGKVAKQVEQLKKRQAEKAKDTTTRHTEKHLPSHKQPHTQQQLGRREGAAGERERDDIEERQETEVKLPAVEPVVREEKAREEESRRKAPKDSAWDAEESSRRRQERLEKGVERRKLHRNHSILEKREQQRRREQQVQEQKEREEREAAEREERRLEAERTEAEVKLAEERRRQQQRQREQDDAALQRAAAAHAETAAREAAQRAAAAQSEKKEGERAKPGTHQPVDLPTPRRSSRLSSLPHHSKPADDDSIHTRLQARRVEQAERERKEEAERVERERLHPGIERQVRARTRGKDYVGLVREFAPQLLEGKGRVVDGEVRKVLRRCMALFHPDKQVTRPLRERIECEEVFAHVKKAYEELP